MGPPIEHIGNSPLGPIVYTPPAGQKSRPFVPNGGKYGRRSFQLGVSLVVLLFSSAHSSLADSINLKLFTHALAELT